MFFNTKGFTLTEILLTITLSSIIITGVYSAYNSQQKSFTLHEQISDAQQNLRVAVYVVEQEIRMAGYDPAGVANAGLLTAGYSNLEFTIDRNKNGSVLDPGERIRYALTNDADGDGIFDGTPCHLGRGIDGGALVPVADNIDALNFVYLDQDGNVLDDDGNGNVVASMPNIRSIQVTLVARTSIPIQGYVNASVYTNQQDPPQVVLPHQGDGYPRRIFAFEVMCRNLGF